MWRTLFFSSTKIRSEVGGLTCGRPVRALSGRGVVGVGGVLDPYLCDFRFERGGAIVKPVGVVENLSVSVSLLSPPAYKPLEASFES